MKLWLDPSFPTSSRWNDAFAGVPGYLIEYALPEPSSACALLACLVLLMRRRPGVRSGVSRNRAPRPVS
jgi:hypothetical protein